ncbi:MAG: ATP-binding cassette domain-containing protein [Acidobacteria bacterium Pan2503]|uniref:ATP-binding cassette domain-containing protein n=1 Tax=Candidatus Acidiferrum panamense TaxID=2741543 RepID=A0A7V8SZN4_9BACT|nr:ATP-binding cassette domain-containing protein [Candidatus Acidoferrum panamensis]
MIGDGSFPFGEARSAIVFDNVRIGFDEGEILRGVSFCVRERETVVLLGETGTGKTLTLKMAAGLLRPDSGSIDVLGQKVSQMEEKELLAFRRKIGFMFQEGALFDSLTVAENVAYRLHEDAMPAAEIEPRVREVLRFVELEHTMDQLPSELSGGMRRRVSIARALANRPPIVLYDSPTAGLDPVTSQTIITLILRLRDMYGVTALLATHRLQDGFALANFHFDPRAERVVANSRNGSGPPANAARTRFLVYRDGEIYFEGEPEEIVNAKDPYLKRYLV